jgi:hypothetical protein
VPPACRERPGEFQPGAALPTLDLGVLSDQLTITAIEVFGDRPVLRLEAQFGEFLPADTDPEIRNKQFARHATDPDLSCVALQRDRLGPGEARAVPM